MKKLIALLAALACISACAEKEVTGIEMDRHYAEFRVGEALTLTAEVTPSSATDKSLTWSSSQPGIYCKDGLVTATASGFSRIKASHGAINDTCLVLAYSGTITKGSTVYPVTDAKADIDAVDSEYPDAQGFCITLLNRKDGDAECVDISFPMKYMGQTVDLTAKYPFIESNTFPQWAVYSYTNSNENFLGAYYNFGDDKPCVINNVWQPQDYYITKGSFCVKPQSQNDWYEVTLEVEYSNGGRVQVEWAGKAAVTRF